MTSLRLPSDEGTPCQLPDLRLLTALRQLEMGSNVTGGLEQLASLPHLSSLLRGFGSCSPPAITAAPGSREAILQRLAANYRQLPNEGPLPLALSQLSSLAALSVPRFCVTGNWRAALGPLQHLTSLVRWGSSQRLALRPPTPCCVLTGSLLAACRR